MKQKDKYIELFFYLYILIKPFYFFASGSIQVGDIFLCIAFIILIITKKMLSFKKIDKILLLFITAVFCINFLYSLLLSDFVYNKATLFYLFNLIMIVVFRNLVKASFFKNISYCYTFNILVQFLIAIVNSSNTVRYSGTYNDPNQFAFAILSSFFIILCIKKLNKWLTVIISIIVLYLINLSASTGMLLAYLIVVIVSIYLYVFKVNNIFNKKTYILALFILTIILVVVIPIIIIEPPKFLEDNFTFNRIISKLNMNGEKTLIDDRNQSVFFQNIYMILLGSGEGNMSRFNGNIANLEIHSTWLSMLFYYGIAPFSLLICWIKKNIKNCNINLIAVYIALFIEGLTLVNQRQSTFWMLIVLGYYIKNENKEINIK